MSNRVVGKNAVVTGAGSGIGRAAAIRLATEGATVVVLDINPEPAAETLSLIRAAGGRGFAASIDVSNHDSVLAAAAEATGHLGSVDILVNNAGIHDDWATVSGTSDELWDRIINTNLRGPFLVTRALLPAVKDSKGAIVNTASVAGLVAGAGGAAYTVAKHGIIGLTKQTASENGPDVRVNAVLPGAIDTNMTKTLFADNPDIVASVEAVAAGRYAQPDEVANVILFLASDEASFVTGATYLVDGGWTLK